MSRKLSLNKKIFITILVVYTLSIIPLLIMSLYNHPCNDDYVFGLATHKAFEGTHSIAEVLKVAKQVMIDFYNNWQGSFVALFIFALQPAIFSNALYVLVNPFLIFIITISVLTLSRSVFKSVFSMDYLVWAPIGLIVSLLYIELLPSPVQGLYWFNGSIYYTFFYCIMLLMFSFIIMSIKTNKKALRIIYTIVSGIFAFLIGGSNYISLTLTFFSLSVFLIYSIAKKKNIISLTVPFVFVLISSIVNLCAKGNTMRLTVYQNADHCIIKTIINSAGYTIFYMFKWMSPLFIVVVLMLGYAISQQLNKKNINFKKPICLSFLSVFILLIQFIPTVYAMNTQGDGRSLNIIFFSYIVIAIINTVCWFGWMLKKNRQTSINLNKKSLKAIALTIIISILFMVIPIEDIEKALNKITTLSATYSLITGQAKSYDNENKQRLDVLYDETLKKVEFKPLKNKPYLLFYSDLTDNPNYEWSNLAYARYYNKESVIIKE